MRKLSRRTATIGIQARVPAIPVSERAITRFDQLSEPLRLVLETYPPLLSTDRAAGLNGGSVPKLYRDKDEGQIQAVKDGGSTRWLTWSIVFRLANLPEVPTNLPPSPSKGFGSPEANMAMHRHFASCADQPIAAGALGTTESEGARGRRGSGRFRRKARTPVPPDHARYCPVEENPPSTAAPASQPHQEVFPAADR